MRHAVKLSVSVPGDLLERAEQVLARPGEGRSALFARVLAEAVRQAEEAAIDAEYERAYANRPLSDKHREVLNAFTRASLRSLR